MFRCNNPAVELAEFMELVGARDKDVAEAIECNRSTINRIRRKDKIPSAITLMRINSWAAEIARQKRLRRSQRLTWEYLIHGVAV